VEKVGEPRLDLGRQRRRRAWLPRQGHGAARGLRRAAARPGAHLARRRARDTARPRANRPARGTDAKPRTGTRRDTRAGLGRRAGWLPSHSELTHAQERAAMAAGLAQAQEARSAWTGADLVHAIVQNLPTTRTARTRRPRPDSLRRANRKSIYRARRASGTPPRAADHRTATARRRVRRRRAAACVRTGRRAARRRPSLVRFHMPSGT
jgi:hypothetical protein